MKKYLYIVLTTTFLLAAGWLGSGCGTLGAEENLSERPWNEPANYHQMSGFQIGR